MKHLRETQKAVTARLPKPDYLILVEMAEEENTTAAEIIRRSFKAYSTEKDYREAFLSLEQSLTKRIFEICCAVSGLSDEERSEAKSELIARIHGADKNEH